MSSERTKKLMHESASGMTGSKSRVEAIRERNRRKKKIRRWIIAILVVGLLTGAVFFFRSPHFLIKDTVIVGAHVLDANELTNSVDAELRGYYAWVIPKRSVFFFPRQKIEDALRKEFKRIDSFSMTQLSRTLTITVTERKSVYLWCGEEVRLNPEPCYFIDDTGYLFSKAPYFSGSIYFKFFGALETQGPDGVLGGRVLPENYFPSVIQMKEGLDGMNVKAYAFARGKDKEASFILSNEYRSDRQTVLVKEGDDTSILVRNLRAAINVEGLAKELKTKFDTLLYLDLRYPEKVYYKFAGEDDANTVEPTTQ